MATRVNHAMRERPAATKVLVLVVLLIQIAGGTIAYRLVESTMEQQVPLSVEKNKLHMRQYLPLVLCVSGSAPTVTLAPEATPSFTATANATPTATATIAVTPTATATIAVTPTATATIAVTPTATATVAVTPTGTSTASGPFYGMDSVFSDMPGDLALVSSQGAELVGQTFPHDGTPASWLNQLDKAWEQGLQVIAWLWPQGWEWDGAAWQVGDQARLFVQTVAGHPATFAVCALHEPYWKGCWGCGHTTLEQQLLYDTIKAIADVPVYSAVDSMAFWTARGEETAFADGICDYCGTWYHPFRTDGYRREEMLESLYADLSVAHERAPNSKIVWAMQSFAQEQSGLRMPTSAEMYDLAGEVYAAGVDGAMWYPWRFNSLYDDFLFNHPELYGTVRQVYEDHVLPRQ